MCAFYQIGNENEINENLLSSNNGASNVKDLFDYNPITNYFNYNKKADDIKLIDEKKINGKCLFNFKITFFKKINWELDNRSLIRFVIWKF